MAGSQSTTSRTKQTKGSRRSPSGFRATGSKVEKSQNTLSKISNSNAVLIVDDEPHSLEWLCEYIEKFGYQVNFARTQSEAISTLAQRKYRALIIDLGIPGSPHVASSGPQHLYTSYPGLAVANIARNSGYPEGRVFVYSVHDSDEVDQELNSLRCLYLLKGRPGQAKEALQKVLRRPKSSKR